LGKEAERMYNNKATEFDRMTVTTKAIDHPVIDTVGNTESGKFT